MKSIEERAYEFACKNDKPSSFFCDLEKSYKVGATEQKAIDDAELAEVRKQRDAYYDELLKLRAEKVEWVNKACETYEKELRQMKRILNEVKDGAGELISVGGSLVQFLKAMEE